MSGSETLFNQAKQVIPGGVNSPVRAFAQVGGTPVFVKSGKGAYFYDYDDKRYIDYVGSWGPLITGHCHPKILEAVHAQIEHGLSYGAPTQSETTLATKIKQIMPNMELMRFVNSGTEATMTAIRLARAITKRDKIIKFAGCYHGHSDSLLVNAGSGALTLGVPSSPGVPESFAEHTLVAEFNALNEVEDLFKQFPDAIATIIVEPIAGNMGFIKPVDGFLEGLRNLCDQYGALLIFDEVMTGFRVGLGGVQAEYNIKPDLTTLGKVIGAGMPVGAFGGKREHMEQIAPMGPVYQAGTLSGNPIAMAAGLANLELISETNFFSSLADKTEQLVKGFQAASEQHGVPLQVDYLGGMFGFFFSSKPVRNLADAKACNIERFKKFFHLMLEDGIYLAPSAFEAGFVSSAHTKEDIEFTIAKANTAMAKL